MCLYVFSFVFFCFTINSNVLRLRVFARVFWHITLFSIWPLERWTNKMFLCVCEIAYAIAYTANRIESLTVSSHWNNICSGHLNDHDCVIMIFEGNWILKERTLFYACSVSISNKRWADWTQVLNFLLVIWAAAFLFCRACVWLSRIICISLQKHFIISNCNETKMHSFAFFRHCFWH